MGSGGRRVLLGLTVGWLGAMPPLSSGGENGALRPLLPGNPRITSSFGEYRRGHYHGGLDYSTGGRVGLPLSAPAPGTVARVRASGVGYGRAVYFRLDDGRTLVLAHLSRFAPPLEKAVIVEQDRLGSYEVDLLLPDPGLRFEAGEVIAYTGQSGAGPPHLHAEIRVDAAAAVAVNPVDEGWGMVDTEAPTLDRILLAPAAPTSRIDGACDTVVVDLRKGAPAVSVSGPVRLWVESSDRAAPGGNRLAPYELTWWVDDELAGGVRFDRFDWHWAREAEVTFLTSRARLANERWIRLQPVPGVRGDLVHEEGGGAWTSSLPPGRHLLRIRAEDAAGNTTERTLVMEVETENPGATTSRLATAAGLQSRGPFLWWHLGGEPLSIEGIAPSGLAHEQEGILPAGAGGRVVCVGPPLPQEPGQWSLRAHLADGTEAGARAVWLGPGGGVDGAPPFRLTVSIGDLLLEIPAGAAYEPMWVTVGPGARLAPAGAQDTELVPVTPLWRLGPWAEPLRERVEAALLSPRPGDRTGLALYALESGSWRFVGADTSGEGVGGRLTNLEDLALLRDLTPPRVAVLPVASEARPSIRARITDGGAGLWASGLRMHVDGVQVIAEWDPEADLLHSHLRDDLVPGEHRVVVEATDRVGNTSRAGAVFTVP